jgi:hypothetical protein
MPLRLVAFAAALALLPGLASAELAKVSSKTEFVELVSGKTLRRPFVSLQVTPEGAISGTGAAWDVEGNWTWQDGYFCRDLYWGGDPLGYNCQEVRRSGDTIRFTSDRGNGRSADFRLR